MIPLPCGIASHLASNVQFPDVLQGKDAVPDTVHHVIVPADPADARLQHLLSSVAGSVTVCTWQISRGAACCFTT